MDVNGKRTDDGRDTKFLTVPVVISAIVNRICALGPGNHLVILVKSSTGGRGVVSWSVIEGRREASADSPPPG